MVTRTTNADEMNPETAKIGALWESFYSNIYPKLSASAKVYGLYTNYESDTTGAFDVVACTDAELTLTDDNTQEFQMSPGSYLKFSAMAELPGAVIDIWGSVWGYFDSADCAHTKAFTTDFELYVGEREVEIYISILD